MKKHLIAVLVGILAISGLAYYNNVQNSKLSLGGTCTKFVGALPVNLSGAGITASATTIPVTSATIKQTGLKLAITDFTCSGGAGAYLTLEPTNSSRQEFAVCAGLTQNSNGTAIFTSCTRGLAPISPYTASTTMRFAHGGGTTVIISNSPPFYDTFANKNNDGTITGQYTFASSSLPQTATNTTDAQLVANGTSTLATLNYVNNVAIAGASNATEAVKGIVELATALENASSTIFGSTGASAVMQSRYATDTPQAGCSSTFPLVSGSGCSVIATLGGKIRQTWLDIFTTANTWTDAQIFSAATTHSATSSFAGSSLTNNAVVMNALAYQWPTVRGNQTQQFLTDNGTGVLTWATSSASFLGAFTGFVTTTAGASVVIATTTLPANTFTTNMSIEGSVFLEWVDSAALAKNLKLTIGTTDCVTAGGWDLSANTARGVVYFSIYTTTSASSQVCTLSWAPFNVSTGAASNGMAGAGTASVSNTSSISLNLSVVQNSTGDTVTSSSGFFQKIKM